MVITIIVIVAVALTGLTMINIDPVSADRMLAGVKQVNPAASSVNDQPGASVEAGSLVGSQSDPSVLMAVVKMFSALALVILLVYGALYSLRRLMGRKNGAAAAKDTLAVLQTTCVGQHKTISLVKVGKRSVLVGVTDHQISTLTELSIDETEEIIKAVARPIPEEGFSRILATAKEKLTGIGLKKQQAALET